MSEQIQIVTVGGHPVRYFEGGDPASTRVLLLVHAFPVGARLFAPQLDAFPGWRVLAPAIPGFDGSPLLPDPPSVDRYARLMTGLLDALGIARAVVGGVSMGGYITFAMARQARERLSGIVLADTRSQADTEQQRAGRQKMLETIAASGPAGVASEMIPKLLGETTRQKRPELATHVRQLIEGQAPEGIAAAVKLLMDRPDATPMLGRIAAPALVIVGSEDSVSPPAEMREMAAAIPGATFSEVPSAGHLANLEAPDVFNAILSAWLSTVPE